MDSKRIFVTGACGYKGTVLVPKLLSLGYQVTAFDIMWFGNYLMPHPNLTVSQGDIREADKLDLRGYDAIIHLSSVANDPCSDLDPLLTWEISCLATMRLADQATLLHRTIPQSSRLVIEPHPGALRLRIFDRYPSHLRPSL